MGQAVRGATPSQTGPQFDRALTQLLILGNQKEIATSQFAQGHASADSVKNFAQRMIREHTDFVDRLQQVALGARQGQGAQTSSAGQQQQQPQAQDPLLGLIEQIGQRDIQLTQQELQRHQGTEFDAAYIGQQLVAHLEMLAALQASEQHASPQLKQLINQGVQVTEQHLNEARGIMSQLQQQIVSTARREAGGQQK
jgi:predicted outer membrane protein